MSDTEIQILLNDMTTVHSYLVAAQGVLDSGYMPDITDLENRVSDLCERIQKAPQEVHGKCLTQLVTILEQLNSCETKMRVFHAKHTTPEGNP